jgi:hypothetical protein
MKADCDRRGGGMWKHGEVKKEWLPLEADGNISQMSRADQTCF